MATEHVRMPYGAFGRLARSLARSYSSQVPEDTTGSLPQAWWRVAIHPTPATFRAWGKRTGPTWIITSLLVGSLAVGLSAALGTYYDPLVESLHLNAQGRYLIYATVGHVIARAAAGAISLLPITLAVLAAIAFVTRPRQAGGLRAQWTALLPAWALAHPAFGLAQFVSSAGALGLAASLQRLHVTSSTIPPGIVYTVLSIIVSLVLAWAVLGYMFGVFSAAVQSVIPQPAVTLGCLAVCVYLAIGIPVSLALSTLAQALGIPGPLFG